MKISKNIQPSKTKKISPWIWLFIPFWILIIAIAGQGNFVSQILQSFSAEDANLAINLTLLIPIALVAFPMTYNLNLDRYMPRSYKKPETSKLARGVFSVLYTATILTISWYALILLTVVL